MDEMLLFYVDFLTKDAKAEDSVEEENNTHPNSEMDILQEISFFKKRIKYVIQFLRIVLYIIKNLISLQINKYTPY